jgi:hypothetical protein
MDLLGAPHVEQAPKAGDEPDYSRQECKRFSSLPLGAVGTCAAEGADITNLSAQSTVKGVDEIAESSEPG